MVDLVMGKNTLTAEMFLSELESYLDYLKHKDITKFCDSGTVDRIKKEIEKLAADENASKSDMFLAKAKLAEAQTVKPQQKVEDLETMIKTHILSWLESEDVTVTLDTLLSLGIPSHVAENCH